MLKREYPSNIHISGVVPLDDYYRKLSQADVLVNLSNNAKLQAPHKLMELVSTGKPIINFYYFKNTGYKIIEKYPLGINVSNYSDPRDMVEAISVFINNNRNKKLGAKEINDIYSEYLLLNQMESIKRVLQN